jgi:hypothetical protein
MEEPIKKLGINHIWSLRLHGNARRGDGRNIHVLRPGLHDVIGKLSGLHDQMFTPTCREHNLHPTWRNMMTD